MSWQAAERAFVITEIVNATADFLHDSVWHQSIFPMTINAFQETLVSFADAVKRLPRLRGGKPIAVSTIYRWALAGSKAADGTRVRLETIKIGGACCTSLEALQRFFDRLQEYPTGGCTDVAARSLGGTFTTPRHRSRQREAEILAAERRLRVSGFDGDAQIFKKSSVSKERLCDLHEFLHGWMPEPAGRPSRAFLAVRSGIFAHAVEILEGKHGPNQSLEAAKQWIGGLDLTEFDVQQLHGVGPTSAVEWAAMLETPVIQSVISQQRAAAIR
jgi:hypothetical protein